MYDSIEWHPFRTYVRTTEGGLFLVNKNICTGLLKLNAMCLMILRVSCAVYFDLLFVFGRLRFKKVFFNIVSYYLNFP